MEGEAVWFCECGRGYRFRLEEIPNGTHQASVTPALITEAERVTGFERRVLSCVASGMTDKEAAAQLGVSTNQVRYAVRDAITRLASHNRTEAVAVAIAAGLIEVLRSLVT